ncbi:IS630 family transposase [Microvirga zambiensis]|uniref:IS630 family transposase n=1 Tax=Microvirga zambiensis TaxID=1402137 RepID=UPI00191E98D2|nr:IS630 family transposase [Microvirga zambiensis]
MVGLLSEGDVEHHHPAMTAPIRRFAEPSPHYSSGAFAAEHPDARLHLWCQDEARLGQKGRTTRVWDERGVRPPGVVDRRFERLYLLAACRPGTDEAFALALPRVHADAMTVLLEHFSRQLAPGVHAVLVLDQAGWHDERALHVPASITLLSLPSASPELNPVERIWLYLRERDLSHRVLDDDGAVLEAVCRAWTRLLDEAGRLTTLTAYPYLTTSEIP